MPRRADVTVGCYLSGGLRDAMHQSLYLWSKTLLPNSILTVLGDRMEMAHSMKAAFLSWITMWSH